MAHGERDSISAFIPDRWLVARPLYLSESGSLFRWFALITLLIGGGNLIYKGDTLKRVPTMHREKREIL